jgi:ABC-type Fe3+/spermidine/putrescine transport system ATPase subunit
MGRRVEEVLQLVGLTALADRMPHQLSGGQQQRVALARALVFDPPVLLMDEPLGALDRKLRGHLQLEIKQLQHRLGVTVIYVTHDQEEALVLSDRIAIMNRGRLEQVGTPADLYERPVNQFVADFIGESNFLPGTVAAHAEGVWTVRLAEGAQVQVRGNGGWPPGSRVLLALRPEDLAVAQAPVAGANCLAGEIEEVLFVGESTKYAVRVSPALFLSARVQRGAAQFRQGDRVVLHWGVSAGRLLTPSEQEGR